MKLVDSSQNGVFVEFTREEWAVVVASFGCLYSEYSEPEAQRLYQEALTYDV